jgi:single-strand DNA-binding protein
MSFNKFIGLGNITRNPELRYLPSGVAVAEFCIALNHKWKSESGEVKEDVCFLDAVAFGGRGEAINNNFEKGDPILIEGRLKYEQWESKDGGGKRNKIKVVVESFSFIKSKSGDGSKREDAPQERETPVPGREAGSRTSGREQPQRESAPIDDSDIPF